MGLDASTIPLLVFFYILLSDWRKREKMFVWESDSFNKDTYLLMQEIMAMLKAAFPS